VLLGTHEGGLESLAVASDGTVISCGADGRVIAWRSAEEVLFERPGLRTIAISRDGTIVAGSQHGRVFRVRSGAVDEPYGRFDDSHGGVGSVAISPDGSHVALGGGLSEFAIHAIDGPRRWHGQTYKWPYVVRFSPFDRRVLCATWQPDLHVVDLDALPPEGDLYGDYPGTGPVFDAAFLADGQIVTVGATEDAGFVRVDGEELTSDEGMHAVVLADDVLVVGGNDQSITAYDARTLSRRGSHVLGEPWAEGGRRADVPSHAPFYSTSGDDAIVALARRRESIVCGTAGGRILELPLASLR
jgi:WD40 repeat protein